MFQSMTSSTTFWFNFFVPFASFVFLVILIAALSSQPSRLLKHSKLEKRAELDIGVVKATGTDEGISMLWVLAS
jgi:hypothetical protein